MLKGASRVQIPPSPSVTGERTGETMFPPWAPFFSARQGYCPRALRRERGPASARRLARPLERSWHFAPLRGRWRSRPRPRKFASGQSGFARVGLRPVPLSRRLAYQKEWKARRERAFALKVDRPPTDRSRPEPNGSEATLGAGELTRAGTPALPPAQQSETPKSLLEKCEAPRGGGTALPPQRSATSAKPSAEEGGPRGKHGFPRDREAEKEGFEPSMEAFTPITP